jgi:hypothetical protein
MFAAFGNLDWQGREFYAYLAVAGAVVVVLSLVLSAVPGSKVKVPGIVLAIVGGIGIGVAGGVILMGTMGYDMKKMEALPPDAAAGPPMMPNMGGPPGLPGRGGPGGGRGGGGPNHKAQLASLVGKLDALTEKPLEVRLSDEQRKKIKELLKGVDADDLSDADAEKKAKELHELLADQKETLKAAGYPWPGEGGGRGGPGGGRGRGGPDGPPNPFKAEDNAKHLKSLEERLDKPAKG